MPTRCQDTCFMQNAEYRNDSSEAFEDFVREILKSERITIAADVNENLGEDDEGLRGVPGGL